MTWLARWFGKSAALSAEARARLDAWRALPEPDEESGGLASRVVVVDVESSGLDVRRDRLIAIGAIAVESLRIDVGAGFSVVLRQEVASEDADVLVHRIGGSAQTGGVEPVDALLAFLEFIGKSPLVGYHARFDEIMIAKSTCTVLGERFIRHWIDLAYLAPALHPDTARDAKGLDDWADAFGIANFARHNALADALATAQLYLALCAKAGEQGLHSLRALRNAAESQQWLQRSRH